MPATLAALNDDMNNLLSSLPANLAEEQFDALLTTPGVRIERIVSLGHTSPAEGWYDQDEDEWVLVLTGSGTLEFADGRRQALAPGDYLYIPAHQKHRVCHTHQTQPTVWLAVFFPPQNRYAITPITAEDDAAICRIIQHVGAEFGAVGEGFGPGDEEVLCMSRHYCLEHHSRYFVARLNGEIVGGAGLAPLNGMPGVCELKKLFLLPAARGHGIGRQLADACLDFAAGQGFASCYLDTLGNMSAAICLYEQLGFRHLKAPLAGSVHGGCDVWMLKDFGR
ncbi:L-amino acid N-acyltransferase YncA [Oceanimonas baumannii]|uniref:L-amino acid N-acyltransferase YncA n=2 Tax=Oceanimonas baumannii TaxID=129578 RepID=A0ABY2EVT7_9GAMM|nr:L-amino acid N-acyltransferase YncA [Oceanimonas baumannii]